MHYFFTNFYKKFRNISNNLKKFVKSYLNLETVCNYFQYFITSLQFFALFYKQDLRNTANCNKRNVKKRLKKQL